MITPIVVQAELVFEFTSKQDWVNRAQRCFKPYPKSQQIICLDINGNICHQGEDFMIAEDNDLYPVKCFRLVRSIEMNLTGEEWNNINKPLR